jgi:hypothetical protein
MSEWKKAEGKMMTADVMWDFSENKVFTGIYKDRKDNVGENDSTILYFETNDGDLVGVWANAYMLSRFEDNDIQPGMEVQITYTGKQKTKNGKYSFKTYDILFREPAEGKAPAKPATKTESNDEEAF